MLRMEDCFFECDELTALDLLELFINSDIQNFLHLYPYFKEFMRINSRYNHMVMDLCNEKLKNG
jgi:hypothetical protein